MRVVLTAGLATGLIVAVVVLAGGGSDDGEGAAAADPECLRRWNADPAALTLGRHQSLFHRYTSVQVLRLDVEGGTFAADVDGSCAVAYASAIPAREERASAQILDAGRWVGLSTVEGVTPELLGRLQDDAIAGANAALDVQGRLVPI
jgi:hypothetical protein